MAKTRKRARFSPTRYRTAADPLPGIQPKSDGTYPGPQIINPGTLPIFEEEQVGKEEGEKCGKK